MSETGWKAAIDVQYPLDTMKHDVVADLDRLRSASSSLPLVGRQYPKAQGRETT